MANLKNITDLPVAESAEGLNLIVNDNGSAKQIAASAVGAQADWSQNDSSAPDYVHNRTHYVEEEVILEQQVIDGFAEMDGMYGCLSSVQFELSESDEVKVSWDGEIYNCVVTSNNNYLYIGNMFALGKEDTGEPFGIMQVDEGWGFVSFTDSSTSHEVGITREAVHKLDSKYLPTEEWDFDITVNISSDSETGDLIFTPNLNAGTFSTVKDKILANEKMNIKVQSIYPSQEDSSIVGYENCVIYTTAYVPQNLFGDNPEMIGLVYHSYISDCMMQIYIYPDNTLEAFQY